VDRAAACLAAARDRRCSWHDLLPCLRPGMTLGWRRSLALSVRRARPHVFTPWRRNLTGTPRAVREKTGWRRNVRDARLTRHQEVAMRHRRSRSATPTEWPPTLRHLIRTAELECPRGHAEALSELTALALRKVPSRGIFDPAARGEDDLFVAIESVARSHLELANARAAWRAALDAAALSLERRDD